MKIPYEHIDYEMRKLIYILNKTDFIETCGCCIGHNDDPISEVIFKVCDREKWHILMIKLLELGSNMKDANINFYEWHRLDLEGRYLVDWRMTIEAHPRNSEDCEVENKRLLRIKNKAMDSIIKVIEKEVEIAALPQ